MYKCQAAAGGFPVLWALHCRELIIEECREHIDRPAGGVITEQQELDWA